MSTRDEVVVFAASCLWRKKSRRYDPFEMMAISEVYRFEERMTLSINPSVVTRPAKRLYSIQTLLTKKNRRTPNKIYLTHPPLPPAAACVGLSNAHDSHQQGTCVSRSPSPKPTRKSRGGRNVSQALPFVLRASVLLGDASWESLHRVFAVLV